MSLNISLSLDTGYESLLHHRAIRERYPHLLETSHDGFIFATQSIDHRSAASAVLGSLLEMLNLGLNQNLHLARSWGGLYVYQNLRSPG